MKTKNKLFKLPYSKETKDRMSTRFTDSAKWNEDWYCELGGEYQKLWDYICDHCDNAGVWKPNKIDFETKTKFKVSLDSFFQRVNGDKERVYKLGNGRWLVLGFIKYQWFNKKPHFDLNLKNKLHKSLFDVLSKNNVPLYKVVGLTGVSHDGNDVIDLETAEVIKRSGRGLEGVLKTSRDKDRVYVDNKGIGNNPLQWVALSIFHYFGYLRLPIL